MGARGRLEQHALRVVPTPGAVRRPGRVALVAGRGRRRLVRRHRQCSRGPRARGRRWLRHDVRRRLVPRPLPAARRRDRARRRRWSCSTPSASSSHPLLRRARRTGCGTTQRCRARPPGRSMAITPSGQQAGRGTVVAQTSCRSHRRAGRGPRKHCRRHRTRRRVLDLPPDATRPGRGAAASRRTPTTCSAACRGTPVLQHVLADTVEAVPVEWPPRVLGRVGLRPRCARSPRRSGTGTCIRSGFHGCARTAGSLRHVVPSRPHPRTSWTRRRARRARHTVDVRSASTARPSTPASSTKNSARQATRPSSEPGRTGRRRASSRAAGAAPAARRRAAELEPRLGGEPGPRRALSGPLTFDRRSGAEPDLAPGTTAHRPPARPSAAAPNGACSIAASRVRCQACLAR